MQHVTPSETSPLGIALKPDELHALYLVGHELFERGAFVKAANVFRLIVLVEPLHVESWQALGACHEELDDVTTAGALYRVGFIMGGHDAKLGFLQARSLWRGGDHAEARMVLDALDVRGSDSEVQAGITALYEALEVSP